jgi:hypothetical protein
VFGELPCSGDARDARPGDDDVRAFHRLELSYAGSMLGAIVGVVAFLDSENFETAIRNAISLGGDADTLACICGGIAHAFYGGVPADLADAALDSLGHLRVLWDEFQERFAVPTRG